MAITPRRKPTTTAAASDEEIIATVVENETPQGEVHRRITYNKPLDLLKNESANNQTDVEDESESALDFDNDLSEDEDFENIPLIPKDKIDLIFEDIKSIAPLPSDYFFAKITRLPDSMQDRFFVPCGTEMPLGIFQFGLSDRFEFITAIQRLNGDSGGRFNIGVYNSDKEILRLHRGFKNKYSARPEAVYKEVGAINVTIPNPAKRDELPENGNNQNVNMLQMMQVMQQKSDERLERLMLSMKEKSTLEKAIEQKMLQDLLNPPKPADNDFMKQFLMMPVMMQEFAGMMRDSMKRPEPAPPPEKTWIDQVINVAQLPPVQSLLEKIGDIAEAVTVAKLNQGYPQQAMENPEPAQINAPQDNGDNEKAMQELVTRIVKEIETDNPINSENQTIAELMETYPEQLETVKGLCRAMDFTNVLGLLMQATAKLNPSPFLAFLDVEQTQATDSYVWTERGQKAIARLNLVYEFLKA